MKSSRALTKALSILGLMALALSGCATSGYAEVTGPTCPPYDDGWNCSYPYPYPYPYAYGFYDGEGGWWDRDHFHHGDDRGHPGGFAGGPGHGPSPYFANGGFSHGGFSHGGGHR